MMKKTVSSPAASSDRRNHVSPRPLSATQRKVIRLRYLIVSLSRQRAPRTSEEAERTYRSAVYRLTHDEYVRGVRKLEDAAAAGHEDARFLLEYLATANRNKHGRPCLGISGHELTRALEGERRRRNWELKEEEARRKRLLNEAKIRLTATECLLSEAQLQEAALEMKLQQKRAAERKAQAANASVKNAKEKSSAKQGRKGVKKSRQNTAA